MKSPAAAGVESHTGPSTCWACECLETFLIPWDMASLLPSPKCTKYFENAHFLPQADAPSGEERIKMKNSKSQALLLPGFFLSFSVSF